MTQFEKVEAVGTLSPSSFQMYLACNRKYFYKKILKAEPDADADLDTKPFMVGKAFHQVLEKTMHKLKGVGLSEVMKVCSEFDLTEDESIMVGAMLGRYRRTHEKAGLDAVACEVEINTEVFRGFIDVVLSDKAGNWWIGDMKTAASYNPAILPTLPGHVQLNLYAAHAEMVAKAFKLDPEKFIGCRYRLTTKSKLIRKNNEDTNSYFARLSSAIKSLDIVIPWSEMPIALTAKDHAEAAAKIEQENEVCNVDSYPKNTGNCMNYHKPCEYWSRCHGFNYTKPPTLKIIEGE